MTTAERFEVFRKKFIRTDIWKAMMLEHEGSPWHRESNVAVHSDMLLSWYRDNLAGSRTEFQRMLTMVACLFHDVAKPPSRIVKTNEERGEYRAYHGHELMSSRMWVDYATDNLDVKDILLFTKDDIAFVALMLEHHVPFSLKKVQKLMAMKAAFYNRFGEAGHRAWLDLLLSDNHGRISDNHSDKLIALDLWISNWESLAFEYFAVRGGRG